MAAPCLTNVVKSLMGLEHLEFVMALEREFDVRIESADMQSVSTVGDVQDLVTSLLIKSGRSFLRDNVCFRVCRIITKVGSFRDGLDPARLTRDMKLIEDLGWG